MSYLASQPHPRVIKNLLVSPRIINNATNNWNLTSPTIKPS